MQFSNLSALSLPELKALAISKNAVPTGDKRSKQAWIDAIELRQREAALEAVEPSTDEEFEAALSERECLGEFTDSEMEAMAVAVDIANGNNDMWGDESASQEIVEEEIDFDEMMDWCDRYIANIKANAKQPIQPAPEPTPVAEQALVSNKSGAIAIIAMLLCAIIAVVQATIVIGCATGKLLVYGRSILTNQTNWNQICSQQRRLDIAIA